MRISLKMQAAGLLAICLLLSFPLGALGEEKAKEAPKEPETHAQAAALIDVTSGRILYSSHGDEELPIASLTKIMTAIVAIEHGKTDQIVKVGNNAYRKEGSSIYLHLGEEMSLENMLYGLMLRSGNDAATAIAEHVGGSEQGFVHLMNEKAKLIGLSHTQFQNPHGLDAKGHYSSANDLAKLTAYALHNPLFKEIVRTPTRKAPNPYDPWDYRWDNKNKMLRFYEGADGVKTGYTKIARRCLVSSATRNGQQLVAVTINDGDDWNDHRKLLDYGFANFPLKSLIEAGQPVQNGLAAGTAFSYPLSETEADRVEIRLVVKNGGAAAFGYRGSIRILLAGREIGKVPVYEQDSDRPSPAKQTLGNAASSLSGTQTFRRPGTWPGSLAYVFRALLFAG
ncbi:D-alanyl-D-alanine carboxypeptidase family protein [Paenibacillus sp. M1]|uniref:D-alanyl-D-alanine carboxypeptidase family protein n=1 Tax=Paenibacillus haidiansis TaxID=1574488 RepID=A0ABU7VME0_9BACL